MLDRRRPPVAVFQEFGIYRDGKLFLVVNATPDRAAEVLTALSRGTPASFTMARYS
jgi:hypothetical protein